MTDRERWTVYPLLFLALGISLKDKLARSVETDRIECKTLVCEGLEVAGPEREKRVTITQGNIIAKGGILTEGLEVSGPKPGQRVTVAQGNILCRTLIATDETGKLQLAVVSSNQDGGILRTFGTHTGTHAVLGNFNQYAGLLFVDARGAAHAGPMFGSPVPVKKPEEQSGAAPSESAAPAEQPSLRCCRHANGLLEGGILGACFPASPFCRAVTLKSSGKCGEKRLNSAKEKNCEWRARKAVSMSGRPASVASTNCSAKTLAAVRSSHCCPASWLRLSNTNP